MITIKKTTIIISALLSIQHANSMQDTLKLHNLYTGLVQLLHNSAHARQAKEVVAKNPAIVNYHNPDGQTLLHLCAVYGDATLAQLLIRHKANINATDRNKATALHYAVFYDHPEIVHLLLIAGAHTHCTERRGLTAAHLAVRLNLYHILDMLIQEGHINVNIPDAFGAKPLHWAALNGNINIAQLLVNAGAHRCTPDANGHTPFDIACIMDNHRLMWLLGTDIRQEINQFSTTDSDVIVYNANTAISNMWIVERSSAVRQAKQDNPRTIREEKSLWEIKISKEGAPYILSIESRNKVYQWLIDSFENGHGSELMLFQKQPASQEPAFILKQCEELAGKHIHQRIVPLANSLALPN